MSEPTSAQYSLTIRVRSEHKPGYLGRVTTAVGAAGGTIGSIDLITVEDEVGYATGASAAPPSG